MVCPLAPVLPGGFCPVQWMSEVGASFRTLIICILTAVPTAGHRVVNHLLSHSLYKSTHNSWVWSVPQAYFCYMCYIELLSLFSLRLSLSPNWLTPVPLATTSLKRQTFLPQPSVCDVAKTTRGFGVFDSLVFTRRHIVQFAKVHQPVLDGVACPRPKGNCIFIKRCV
jgi:hypothetical protein